MRNLSSLDISARRREDLRARCHAVLIAQARDTTREPSVWRRVVGPVIAAAWGAIYLLQTLRIALA